MNKKHIYNLKKTPESHQFHSSKLKVSPPSTTPLPPVVDLRTTRLLDPVYNQGELGSCSANAFAAAFNYNLKTQNLPSLIPNPSRLFLYYNERVMENAVNDDSGAMLGDGCISLQKNGICSEKLWEYDISKFTIKPITDAYTEAAENTLVQFNAVHNLNDIKHSLAGHNLPVVMGLMLYASFEGHDVASNGIVPMPNVNTEERLGGHAVLCVGYHDPKQWLIVRNSWGDGWGDHGYFYLDYSYINSGLMIEAYSLQMVK